jgi:hypothetical protein
MFVTVKKAAPVIVLILLATALFSVKYFTTLLDSKDSVTIVNKAYTFKDDYTDKRKLAKAVDNIFIGEVIREVGTEEYTGSPNTQFLVRITQNIKGALLGDITINQEGGYFKEKGKLYLLSYEKTPSLKEDQMYLFAVNRTKKGYFEMMPKYGSERLDNEEEKYRQIKEFTAVIE